MVEDYNFFDNKKDFTFDDSTLDLKDVQPSKSVVQMILNYARCMQCLKVKHTKVFLNLN